MLLGMPTPQVFVDDDTIKRVIRDFISAEANYLERLREEASLVLGEDPDTFDVMALGTIVEDMAKKEVFIKYKMVLAFLGPLTVPLDHIVRSKTPVQELNSLCSDILQRAVMQQRSVDNIMEISGKFGRQYVQRDVATDGERKLRAANVVDFLSSWVNEFMIPQGLTAAFLNGATINQLSEMEQARRSILADLLQIVESLKPKGGVALSLVAAPALVPKGF